MLRLFQRVTLNAIGRDASAENLTNDDDPVSPELGQAVFLPNHHLLHLHAPAHAHAPPVPAAAADDDNDDDDDLEPALPAAPVYAFNLTQGASDHLLHDSASESESDREAEEISADPRENLLVNRRHHRRTGSSSNRLPANRAHRHKKRSMRLTARKRHVVASSNGSQISYHHPTIQAKQNQMYLITTLLPNQCESNVNQPNLINRVLPKELLLRVFSYLDIVSLCRSAQVCREWNLLAMDGSNWQQVDLFRFQKDIRASVVESLARRCGGFLKDLSLRGCENIQDTALRSFASKCPNIERLWLNKCKRVGDDTTEYLGLYCHRLVSLELENCIEITDRSLKFISQGCKHLEDLNVSWCQNITDKGVRLVAENCLNLKSLICKGCEGITASCFSKLGENCLAQLQLLNLQFCVHITDETVEDIAHNCHELEWLSLSNCREITDRSLVALSQGCVKLKDLELALCINVTDAGFIQLSKNCHELERMDLEDCNQITDVTLHHLNLGCPKLSSLSLSHCELLTDNGLAEFCTSHKEILQVLELDNCPLITDAAFEYMKPLKTLKQVDLYDCQQISKEAIKLFKQIRPDIKIQAYFAPTTPPPPSHPPRQGICRCCTIL